MNRLTLTLVHSVALLFLLILHIITPKAVKKTILFGVRVPKDALYYPEVQGLYRLYKRLSQIIGSLALIGISLLVFYFDNIIFQILSIFLYMGILFIIYLAINSKAKKLKKEKNWDKIDSEVIIRDGAAGGLEIENKTEDDLWKLGNTIYCNSKDSSIFVRQRQGTGWTLNMGRPLGIILAIIFIIILLIIIIKIVTL